LQASAAVSGVGNAWRRPSAEHHHEALLLPAVCTSLLHEITPKLCTAGNIRGEDWSSFETQFLTVDGFKTQIDRGWCAKLPWSRSN
jgi:hypothetical protein